MRGNRTFVATRSGGYLNIAELGYDRMCGNIGGTGDTGGLLGPDTCFFSRVLAKKASSINGRHEFDSTPCAHCRGSNGEGFAFVDEYIRFFNACSQISQVSIFPQCFFVRVQCLVFSIQISPSS